MTETRTPNREGGFAMGQPTSTTPQGTPRAGRGRKTTATVRLARWSATNPWRAIGIWVALVAVCMVAGGMAGTHKAKASDMGVGQSGRAGEITRQYGLVPPASENVLITAKSGTLDRAAAERAAAAVTARMKGLKEVAGVGAAMVSADKSAYLVPVEYKGDPEKAAERVGPLEKAGRQVAEDNPGLRVELVGDGSLHKGIEDQVGKDLGTAEMFSLPVTLVILMVAFGALIAAAVPVLLALTAVLGSFGLYGLVSALVPDPGSAMNVIMMIGMAVGVDYSLFYVRREREERAKGLGKIDAIEVAAQTSGHAVVVSGFAVAVSMAGMYVAGDAIFSGLATAGIIVVLVAMAGSLTVLPALLAKLGNKIDRPRVPLLWRLTARQDREPRLWKAMLRPALDHPKATLGISVAALAVLAVPTVGMKLQNSSLEDFPRDMSVIQSYDRMTAAFPGKHAADEIVVLSAPGRSNETRAALDQALAEVGTHRLFTHEAPEVKASADGRAFTVDVTSPYGSTSKQAKDALNALRDDILPNTVGKVSGAEFAVAGDTADNVDYADHVMEKLPLVIGFVLLLTFVMMAFTFRSVVVALTAIAINLLSAMAAFGLLVLVFQGNWAEGILDFTSNGAVIAWLPLFLFVVLFGLSMDYHVFVVSRIREAALSGMSTKQAVERGITSSAGVITSAAIVMVSVFAVFATLSMMDMKQMGVGLAAAVLIDAIVVRIVVLPSLMVLLGHRNWWPSKMPRGLEDTAADSDTRVLHPVA
ncbi:MMPL family transporter [Yinghuangia seranimata]|uniref:MMPL family transporter n=1 Tax=Yinghuangia seranimata TaxID=408067 RepID=UPI00248B796C|nr:MMPL family transporter [Yinghuangia seranimata]MDI2130833.1 MMPL family transporter [Yinghuangia seranimata]